MGRWGWTGMGIDQIFVAIYSLNMRLGPQDIPFKKAFPAIEMLKLKDLYSRT